MEEVKRVVAIGRQYGDKAVVGFGGSSALDAAKAAVFEYNIALLYVHGIKDIVIVIGC